MNGLLLLPNVLVDVSRSRYNSNSGQTGLPQPTLSAITGNISPMTMADYATLSSAPEPALRANYFLMVPTGTDIITGDAITKITLLDGVTPWSGAGPLTPGQIGYGGVVWWVRFYQESSPGFLAYRCVYLERMQATGPA